MEKSDVERLVKRDFVERKISENDPYIEKMNIAALREYRQLHPAVQRTEDLLEKFSLKEPFRFPNRAEAAQMYKTIDDRYYNPKISAKNRLGAIFAAKVIDSVTVKKHIRIRRNPKEKQKLDYLESELKQSPRLREVESDSE